MRAIASRNCGSGALLIWTAIATAGSPARSEPPLPPVRPPPSELQTPDNRAPPIAVGACLAELRANHVEAEAVASPPASLADCGVADPVRLTAIRLANGATLDLPGRPVLDCAFAGTFAAFARDLVAPLGAATLGAPVVALETGPGYECRGRNRIAGAKTSAHGEGVAIDVSAILFADRRRVVVAHQADAQEILFVRTMRRAACGWFSTVLGPGSDPAHADHIHLDVLRHGASDNYRICD